MLSVLGQRGRPSGVKRFEGLKAVGSRPARRASPEGDSSLWRASASIAFQIHAWVRIDDVGLIQARLVDFHEGLPLLRPVDSAAQLDRLR